MKGGRPLHDWSNNAVPETEPLCRNLRLFNTVSFSYILHVPILIGISAERSLASGHDLPDHPATHIGEAERPALEFISEPLVIEAKLV